MNGQPEAPLSPERLGIALEAAWEAEALCVHMLNQFGVDQLALRGMTARLLALAHASMAALGDSGHDVKDIRHSLGCDAFGTTRGRTMDLEH